MLRPHCLITTLLMLTPNAVGGPTATHEFPEVEPNSTKSTATPATLAAGDVLTGVCAGTSTDAASGNIATVDTFLVTFPQQTGIWRHRLTITTVGAVGHTLSLRGRTQAAGIPNINSDTAIQTSSGSTNPSRFLQLYAFGDATPQAYVRIAGNGSTTGAYRVALASERAVWARLPRLVAPGAMVITTVGQSTADTEMLVLDSRFNLVPGCVNDDTPAGPGTPARVQSTLRRTLPVGVYYFGVTDFDAATAEPAPIDDGNRSSPLTDFAGVACTSSTLTGLSIGLQITDAAGAVHTAPVGTTTKAGAFDILWLRARVNCTPADIAELGGALRPDGQVTADDLIAFLTSFFAGDLDAADIASLGGVPAGDGQLTADDVIAFLAAYFAACP